ncbi:MAG: CrcB family protein [Muribaculaceae bacterium]|nr:CrcB family protein [Muribaculaceae bacterium]
MNIWLKILLVGVGGSIGAICRLLLTELINASGIWLGITSWIINTSACFLIGLFAGWLITCGWTPFWKTGFTMLMMVGFCGGFSTFSEYTLDCIRYFESGHVGVWVIFALATVFAGLFCCALGYWLGTKL